MLYRLRYTRDSKGFYRLALFRDSGHSNEKIAGARFTERPKIAVAREWLAGKGFETYGDMLRNSDGSFTVMARPIN